jgi:hypothetical protein
VEGGHTSCHIIAFGVWLVGGACGERWVVELRFFVDVELEVGVEYEDSPRQVPPERPPAQVLVVVNDMFFVLDLILQD